MKGYAFGVLLAVALVLTPGTFSLDCGDEKSHHAYFGTRAPNDQMIYQDRVKLEYKFLRVVETDVDFPPNGEKNDKYITRIELQDQYTDGDGGCGYVVSGGVGHKKVQLHMKSKRNHGLEFIVKIYGR